MESNFIICKLPRTGSSMFGKVLNSHPNVYCRNEFLNPVNHKELEEKLEYFRAFFFEKNHKVDKDIKALGATMNPFKYHLKVSDIAKKIDRSQFKFILLIRKNYLLQARSFYMVKEITQGLRFQLNKEDKKNLKQINFDFAKLEQMTRRFEKKSDRLQTYIEKLSKNNYLFIDYEELLKNRQENFIKIFDYINVPLPDAEFDYSGGREKVLTHDWPELCINFHEIDHYPYLKQFL